MAISEAADGLTDSVQHDGRRRASGGLERVTINLTPRSSRALQEASAITGDTKTEMINRAVRLYEYFEQVSRAGGTVYVRPEPDAEIERLKLFL